MQRIFRGLSTCFAFFPNTKSIASMTLDLPLPLGPTTEEKLCKHVFHIRAVCMRISREQRPVMVSNIYTSPSTKALLQSRTSGVVRITLWKGPTRCSPAYDLKFSRTISVMISLRCGPWEASMLSAILLYTLLTPDSKYSSWEAVSLPCVGHVEIYAIFGVVSAQMLPLHT